MRTDAAAPAAGHYPLPCRVDIAVLQSCYTVSANLHCCSDDAYRYPATENEVCAEAEMQLVTDLDSTCCDGGPAAALVEHRRGRVVNGKCFHMA